MGVRFTGFWASRPCRSAGWLALLLIKLGDVETNPGGSKENSLQAVELSGPQTLNCCHLIPSNRFLDGFPDPSQFEVAKLTHYSTMLHRPSDSSRHRKRLLLSGDVHQNHDPAIKYPCSVCTRNVTSRGMSYMCNRCSGWVHSKCSGLQYVAEYRRIKNWACSSCSSPPTPPLPQPLPSPITTKSSEGDPFIILQLMQMASATNRLN